MKNLIQRTITGIIFVGIIVFSILFDLYAFMAVFGLIVFGSLIEFYSITKSENIEPQKYWGASVGLCLFLLMTLVAKEICAFHFLSIIIPLVIFVFIIELYRKKQNPINNIGYTLFGFIYIVLPFGLMSFHLCNDDFDYSITSKLLVSFFVMVWANDTFAYLSGMMLGRHKLFERISPKKTWEGSIGGALATMLISLFLLSPMFEIAKIHWAIMSILISIFGTYGDLAESMMKRSLGIKDSGSILPGHGGFLDRFDAVIFAFPIFFAYLNFI